MKKPKIGDEIYIRTSLHISRGSDDVIGGLGKISKVKKGYAEGEWFVEVKEVPGHGYNYNLLMEEQERLEKEFGKNRAHPSPDIDTPWIEEGDIVNGKEYHGPPIW